jgi:type I restriction enzyme, S subunit
MEVLQDTYKDTKIGRIPKDWEVTQLASICDIIMGQSPSSESYNEDSIGLPLVQGNADIKSRITKPRIYTSQITKISEIGDVIMTVRAPVGAIAKSNIKCCIGRGVCALRVKFINDEFLYQLLIEKEASWVRLEQGSTFTAVNSKDIKTFKIPVPPLPEQQKIAAILSTVDEQISTTDKIIEKSKELKKGLMQKLFSEGIGHTEFKDTKIGRIPKDWEVLRLGEVCLKIRDGNYGGSYPKANEFLNSGVPFLTSASIGGGNFIIKKKIKFISPEKHSELTKAHIKFGDVLFTNRGANVGSVALVHQELDDANIGPQLTYLRCKLDVIDNQYLFSLMQSNSFQKQVKSLDNGTAMNFFGIGTTKTFKLPIPSLPEQHRIANILSEADAKIEKEQTQKSQLEQLKKGLMQQLLTGKKRVNV